MVVNTAALWGLMATCCLVSVPTAVRLKLREARENGSGIAYACLDGVMTGLGAGIGGAMTIFLATATLTRLISD
jgi:hypothetical protein